MNGYVKDGAGYGRALRCGAGGAERNTMRDVAGRCGRYVRNGARGRDEEEREGEGMEESVWVGGNRMGMGGARRAVRNAARGRR